MTNYRKYTIEEFWRPPGEKENSPAECGCPLMDAFMAELHRHGHASVVSMAARLGLSYRTLSEAIKALTGMACSKWIAEWVMRNAEWRLLHTMASVNDIGRAVGFANGDDFGAAFRHRYKLSPGEFRNRNRHVHKETVYKITLREE